MSVPSEKDCTAILQEKGMCGFVDGSDCERRVCILSRYHDDKMHEPPAMISVSVRLLRQAFEALESFTSGSLSDCTEAPLTGYRLEAWNRALNVRGELLSFDQVRKIGSGG